MGKSRNGPGWVFVLAVLVAACTIAGCVAPRWPEGPPGKVTPQFAALMEAEEWPHLTEVEPGIRAAQRLREIRDAAFDALRADPGEAQREEILWAVENAFECFGPDWFDDAEQTTHAQKVDDAHDLLAVSPVDWQTIGDTLTPAFASEPGGTQERWPWVVELEPDTPMAEALREIRALAFDALREDPNATEREDILRALRNAFECFGEDWMSVDPVDEAVHALRVYNALTYARIAGIDWGLVADELQPPH